MRLQLRIQRQGLAPVKLLWNTDGLRPGSEGGERNTSFAQFLEQINEVIPLESDHWGLEHYVIEVHGFECLHFCTLDQLLRDEDEVTIRPFQTREVRQRTSSGRFQITEDGRHLLDGVAFGRPLIKRPTRPPVNIPPPKRLKFTDDDTFPDDYATGLGSEEGHKPLLLTNVDHSDLDEHDGSDSEDRDEYIQSDEEDLVNELQDLVEEQGSEEINVYEDPGSHLTRSSITLPKKRKKLHGLGIRGSELSGSTGDLRNGNLQPEGELDYSEVERSKPAQKRAKKSGARSGTKYGQVTRKSAERERNSRQSSNSSTKSVRFEGADLETPATILEAKLSDGSDESASSEDESFVPGSVSKSLGSNKENLEPQNTSANDETSSSGDSESISSQSSSSDADSDSTSDSDSDSSNPDVDTSRKSSEDFSEETSSRSSSSDTKSDGEMKKPTSVEDKVSVKASIKGQLDSVSTTKILLNPVPPGSGSSRTQRRNERKRIAKKLHALKATGTLPQSATLQDYLKWRDANDNVPSNFDDLEQKRQSLLAAVQSGDTFESLQQQAQVAQRNTSSSDSHLDPPPVIVSETVAKPTTETPEAEKRRAKLDLAGSRRLLFGSLGLKTPKTKAEENKIREKLMENVRKIGPSPRTPKSENNELVTNDDTPWEDKIVLKAVECCYNSGELSKPPFPFVQRWDASQRGPYGSSSKKWKQNKRGTETKDEGRFGGEARDDAPAFSSGSAFADPNINKDFSVDVDMTDTFVPDDLPVLPDDISSLMPFQLVDATPGAVITFKYLEMSASTNWQPIVSGYKTARIQKVSDNGDMELNLALRDQENNDMAVDPSTGERLYSKFEMPGMEDTKDGFLELNYHALEDPRLLQASDNSRLGESSHNIGSSHEVSSPGLRDVKPSISISTPKHSPSLATANPSETNSKGPNNDFENLSSFKEIREDDGKIIARLEASNGNTAIKSAIECN